MGRRGRREYLEGRGEDELAALTYLAIAVEERRDDALRTEMRIPSRRAFLEGAEEPGNGSRVGG